MGTNQSSNYKVDDYIMDHIKHTCCTHPKCRISPCVQHHSSHGPIGYICNDCFRRYREQHEEMTKEAKIARERKERDMREFDAENVRTKQEYEGWRESMSVVLWDGDEELRRWRAEEKKKIKGDAENKEWKGKNLVDLKERFQGMFLPFYVGMEDDEWMFVEGGENASNGWTDM